MATQEGPMKRIAAAATLVAGLSVAGSAAGDEVKVGGQVKQSHGVLRSAEAGDIACYLTLVDDRGREFTEQAEFELCEAPPLGKRVRLHYRIGQVASPRCEGDPDCKLTETVPLVVRLEAAAAANATGFCGAGESVVFQCAAGKGKAVSVCAAADGRTQYRFGRPGTAPELALPATPGPASRAARGGALSYSGGGAAWLRFRSGAHAYVVYTGIGNWGPRGEKVEKQGLVVEKDGARIAHLPCSGPVRSELGPDWFERAGVERGGEDFEIPE
jgi:hypothetical protein